MTDRELLELAAKAEGTVTQDASIECVFRGGPVFLHPFRGFNYQWDPLTDDADAFRLAVKLGLNILTCGREGAETMEIQVGGAVPRTTFQPVGHEGREAATRRAIVRAAAAIGGPHA